MPADFSIEIITWQIQWVMPNKWFAAHQDNNITNSLAFKVLIQIFFIFWVSRECIGIIVFCIRDYISRIRIRSTLMKFLDTSDCTDESRRTKHVCNLRWRSITSELKKSLNIYIYMYHRELCLTFNSNTFLHQNIIWIRSRTQL